jgi:hypothetical protein
MPVSLLRISPRLLAVVSAIAAGIVFVYPVMAEEASGSLENIWSDQSGTAAPTADSASAPMVTVNAFKESPLVQKGAWPGIGPFTSSSDLPYEMVDKNQNRLRIKVADEKVTEAQLHIVKDKPVAADFLDLQMSADFLLEAVGVKDKKIVEFNKEIEKSKDTFLRADSKPLDLPVGRYLVSFLRQPIQGQDKFNYLIRINSQDASKDAIKEVGVTAPTPAPVETAVATPPAPPSGDELKETFAGVIKNWQKIKKSAVRQRQTAELAEILAGRALTKQTDAVKWLASNKKYYDMNPRGVTVEKFTEVAPGKKYVVFALVREASKYIDEASGQTLKETDDTYKVNYTIEKVGERWFITDSALVTNTPPAVKSNAPSKASR